LGQMKRPSYIPLSDADWERTPIAAQALIISLWQRVEQLERVVEQQGARIAALEEELARRQGRSRGGAKQASSSKPVRSSRKRCSSGRKPGGQPGHEGHGRALASVEEVAALVPIRPETCGGCGHPLSGDDPHPRRHQVVDIPPVRAHVTEYQFHTLRCPHCDTLTEAPWPQDVPRRTFGPSVQGWVGLLAGAYRMSKRNVVSLLSDAFGVDLGVGSVSALEQEVSAALAEPVGAAWAWVREQPAVNVDETGWRERRAKAWLWTGTTEAVTTFAIRRSRGRDVVDEILGEEYGGTVGSDRYSAYSHLPLAHRQVCWSHLRRTFEDFQARGGDATAVGRDLLEACEKLFTWWHRVRDGTMQRSTFQSYVSDQLRWWVQYCLWQGQQFADAKTAATCGNLLAVEPALWTFVRREGVEPTNNAAERALRHGVIWRHTSFGTHSAAGSRFVERMLTVRDTLRQQQRNLLDYLNTACHATHHNEPAPSLLPAR